MNSLAVPIVVLGGLWYLSDKKAKETNTSNDPEPDAKVEVEDTNDMKTNLDAVIKSESRNPDIEAYRNESFEFEHYQATDPIIASIDNNRQFLDSKRQDLKQFVDIYTPNEWNWGTF